MLALSQAEMEQDRADQQLYAARSQQILEGKNPVPEYVKGSWLKPCLDALEEPEKSNFKEAYKANVLPHYPPQNDGKTLFPFRRLFIVAQVYIYRSTPLKPGELSLEFQL